MKKDISKTIDLDNILNTKEEPKQEVVENIQPVVIDWDDILLEWSYRLPKGFPTVVDGKFVDREEIIILNEILEERELPLLITPQTTNHLNEASTKVATAFESIIVAVWNNEEPPVVEGIPKDAGKKIVNYLKKEKHIEGTTASKLTTKGIEVTNTWSQFWKPEEVPSSTKTPKTDIIIGNSRISLKIGSAQLMSGGPNESKATFYAAINSLQGSQDKVMKEIGNKLSDLTKGAIAKSSVEAELKKGKDKFLQEANKVNKEVQQLLRDEFKVNPEFRLAFVREAMTGRVKFTPKSPAYAEYVLSSDRNGDNTHLYKTTDNSFLAKVANQASVTVRFKSSSVKKKSQKTGAYRYWSVISLGLRKLDEEFARYEGKLLTELDFGNIITRVKNYIRSMFVKIYDWLKASIKNVMDFFDIEPVVDYSEEINFSAL